MEVFNQAYDELTGENSFQVSSSCNYTSTGKGIMQVQGLVLKKGKTSEFTNLFRLTCLNRSLSCVSSTFFGSGIISKSLHF